MHSLLTILLTTLPLSLSSPTAPSLLFGRASCSTPYGSGTCAATKSCTNSGFNIAGQCPGGADNQCCITKTCTTASGSGLCVNKKDGADACSGDFVTGACPGPADIQCCTKQKCSTASGAGVCQVTSTACGGGRYVAGACPGPAEVQCCVAGGGTDPPPPTGGGELKGIDISAGQSSSFWSCLKGEGIKKVVVRGYQQACGSGGRVDPNMVPSYNAATAAGIDSFDVYMYPCTGTTNGVACKSIQTQLDGFLQAVDDAGIKPVHFWFDIEPTVASAGGCNSWQLGAAANEKLAKDWVAAIKATGRPWGIYANAGQWTSMFASESTDIGSDLPLWAVEFDEEPGVSTTTRFMGGWTKAYAKQYNLDTTLCGGSVDLDSFTA